MLNITSRGEEVVATISLVRLCAVELRAFTVDLCPVCCGMKLKRQLRNKNCDKNIREPRKTKITSNIFTCANTYRYDLATV